MPQARARGALRATLAALHPTPTIGTRGVFAVGPALPPASKTCASLKDAISQSSPSERHHGSLAKETCHSAEGIRIVTRDAAVASRRYRIKHCST